MKLFLSLKPSLQNIDKMDFVLPITTEYFKRVRTSLERPLTFRSLSAISPSHVDVSEIHCVNIIYESIYVELLFSLIEMLINSSSVDNDNSITLLKHIWKWTSSLTSVRAHSLQKQFQMKANDQFNAHNTSQQYIGLSVMNSSSIFITSVIGNENYSNYITQLLIESIFSVVTITQTNLALENSNISNVRCSTYAIK